MWAVGQIAEHDFQELAATNQLFVDDQAHGALVKDLQRLLLIETSPAAHCVLVQHSFEVDPQNWCITRLSPDFSTSCL